MMIMSNYTGVIIEESLSDKSILSEVKIVKTKVEKLNKRHKTPWVKQWTLHTVEIDEDDADIVAKKLSKSLDTSHESTWYADFKNKKIHYVIFPKKIFKVTKKEQYKEVTKYGVSLGIPEYQLF